MAERDGTSRNRIKACSSWCQKGVGGKAPRKQEWGCRPGGDSVEGGGGEQSSRKG